MKPPVLLLLSFLLSAAACGPNSSGQEQQASEEPAGYPTTGSIERLSPAIDRVIPADAQVEILAQGFDWSEGPLWLPEQNMLIFSDVPRNTIYRWQEGDTTASVYLQPSGYTGETPRGGEPGSNGLLLDGEGRLVLCQHGDRRLARMDAPLDQPAPSFSTIAGEYQGKRFNSPNDAVFDGEGNFFMTDPPYGLVDNVDDPAKEIPFQGVYRISAKGEVTLIDSLSRPNGIGLSPDGSRLYVAVSDPANPVWMVYEQDEKGNYANGQVFVDTRNHPTEGAGLPDGLKVDRRGYVFGTGPGGVWIISPKGELLGIVRTGQATANCAFDKDWKYLYLTADGYLMRVRLL